MKKNGETEAAELPMVIEETDLHKMESFRLKIENAQLKILALQNEGKQLQEQNIAFLKDIQARYNLVDGDEYDGQTGKITRKPRPTVEEKPALEMVKD